MRFIIFEYHLVIKSKKVIECNQTFFLMKSSDSSLILIKIYWLNDEGPPSCLLIIVRAYWLDNKDTPLYSSILVRIY